jgi:P-type conjugative transfer protein TrbJ
MTQHTRPMRWFTTLLTLSLLPLPAADAQWVVTDPTNLVENVISALQQVNAVLKQAEQYKTQIDQYTAELRNVAAPAVFVWDLGKDTVETAERVQKKLTNYRQLIRDTDASLRQLGDPDYYKSSPCYNGHAASHGGCGVFLAALQQEERKKTQTEYEANEELFKALDAQHASMNKRMDRLQSLTKSSQDADGQMKVLQAANQLTSAQIAELMEIRSLMITQQNIAVEAKRAELARQAAAQAATASFFATPDSP